MDKTLKLSSKQTISASAPKLNVPLFLSIPKAAAGWYEAASNASTREQPII